MPTTRPSRRGALRSLGVTVVAAAALAACGGSSSSASSSGSSTSSYDKQANAICNQYTGQLNDLSNQIQSASSPTDKQNLLQQQIKVFQQAEGKLNGLQKPSGGTAPIDKALGSLQTVIDDENGVLNSARTGDASGAQTAADKLQTDANQANSDFQAAGITACAGNE
jgi:conjugal transfer/entry exclusion protein